MIRIILPLFALIISTGILSAQELTPREQILDVSMFWKKSGKHSTCIESEDGDLFTKLGHHGPAIENLWVAYRVYFNEYGSVDLFSKFQPGLELKASGWYPDKAQRAEGSGSDNYNVGKTTGLGGIKLWDGNAIQHLGPVSKRSAEVILDESFAQIRMTSLSIPYQGDIVDIEFKITTYKNTRHAVIEVRSLTGTPVQFATGMPVHSELKTATTDHSIVAWGDYNSHEKQAVFNVGTALLYESDDFQRELITDKEHLLISKPTTYLKYLVTSSNDKEKSKLNNYEAFVKYVQQLHEVIR